MNCKEFSNLLEDCLDGMLAEEDAGCLEKHAKECAECAALLALRRDCRKMDENITVPEEFSNGWRQMIREEANMEKKIQKKKTWQSWLATAAALVFILGGTALTRDSWKEKPAETAADNASVMMYSNNAAATYDLAANQKRAATSAYGVADAVLYATEESADMTEEKIIRTAGFTLKTLEYETDLQKIQDMTEEMGGRVEYLAVNGDKGSNVLRTAQLTIRIPAEKLDLFLVGAEDIGTLTSLTRENQDVSENYYDMAARLNTQQRKMERLRILMDAAENIADLIEIENAIADTQYWIDYYTGQLNHYDDQVDYSTVKVSLWEIKITQAEEVTFWRRIASAVQESLVAGAEFLGDMVVFVIAVAPWGTAVGLIIFAVKKLCKKKKEK